MEYQWYRNLQFQHRIDNDLFTKQCRYKRRQCHAYPYFHERLCSADQFEVADDIASNFELVRTTQPFVEVRVSVTLPALISALLGE